MQRSKFTTLEQTQETTQLSINYMIIIYNNQMDNYFTDAKPLITKTKMEKK